MMLSTDRVSKEILQLLISGHMQDFLKGALILSVRAPKGSSAIGSLIARLGWKLDAEMLASVSAPSTPDLDAELRCLNSIVRSVFVSAVEGFSQEILLMRIYTCLLDESHPTALALAEIQASTILRQQGLAIELGMVTLSVHIKERCCALNLIRRDERSGLFFLVQGLVSCPRIMWGFFVG